jgi:hypothetical protein
MQTERRKGDSVKRSQIPRRREIVTMRTNPARRNPSSRKKKRKKKRMTKLADMAP